MWVWCAHFLGTFCHRFGKIALWGVITEPVVRWQIGLRFQDSLYLGSAPLLPCTALPGEQLLAGAICSIVFQELRYGLPVGLPCAWEHFPRRPCLCSFPSLALSRTNVALSPSIKHTIRREGIHFIITQATTHLQSVPKVAFCMLQYGL